MGKKANQSISGAIGAELLNFHFVSSPQREEPLPLAHVTHQQQRNRLSQGTHGTASGRNSVPRRKTDMDRISARRKATSQMFYLHASANHTFALTRQSKLGGVNFTFRGSDVAVSWDSVRIVTYLVPAVLETTKVVSSSSMESRRECTSLQLEVCPICLDTLICTRITKCGHCFCLPCLIRHIHTVTSDKPYSNTNEVKCPCCALPIYLDDLRPVVLQSIQPPRLKARTKLVKLHRVKDCPSPYLPQRGQWKRESPNAIPTMTDPDAKFSRFTYIDPIECQALLISNMEELENCAINLTHGDDLELLFVQMALENVKNDNLKASLEIQVEHTLMERYSQPQAGMYQKIPDHLFLANVQYSLEDSTDYSISCPSSEGASSGLAIGRTRGESIGCESVASSEGNISHRFGKPCRGYSIDSADSPIPNDGTKHRPERMLPQLPASMYLEENSSQFYQSADGQLCFLSKFNMNCLTSEFSIDSPPQSEGSLLSIMSPNERRRLNPLPDEIEGVILEIETLHLTPEIRKRIPVLSHLPAFVDISFVELDLNRILSNETKQQFRKDYEKRKQRRKNKLLAEKKEDHELRKIEERRIKELKSRMQRIDPNDEFFATFNQESNVTLIGEEFGPVIGNPNTTDSSVRLATNPDQSGIALNFSAVVNRNNHKKSSSPVDVVTHEAFPALGAAISLRSGNSQQGMTRWKPSGSSEHGSSADSNCISSPQTNEATDKATFKVKKKKEKVVLFSTGSQRGGY
jgi:RING-type zinc-finger